MDPTVIDLLYQASGAPRGINAGGAFICPMCGRESSERSPRRLSLGSFTDRDILDRRSSGDAVCPACGTALATRISRYSRFSDDIKSSGGWIVTVHGVQNIHPAETLQLLADPPKPPFVLGLAVRPWGKAYYWWLRALAARSREIFPVRSIGLYQMTGRAAANVVVHREHAKFLLEHSVVKDPKTLYRLAVSDHKILDGTETWGDAERRLLFSVAHKVSKYQEAR